MTDRIQDHPGLTPWAESIRTWIETDYPQCSNLYKGPVTVGKIARAVPCPTPQLSSMQRFKDLIQAITSLGYGVTLNGRLAWIVELKAGETVPS